MKTKTYNLRKNTVIVELSNDTFLIKIDGHEYYARYDFNIEDTPEHHIDLMVYFIFYGLDENKTAKVKSIYADIDEGIIVGNNYTEVEVPYYEKEGQVIEDLSKHTDEIYHTKGNNKLIMFSGGYDSTAIKVLVPEAKCVYLHRDYDLQYGANQREVVKLAKSHVVYNNIEQIRILYKGRPGFNTGNGYASLIIPYLNKHNANEILCGAVLDDVGFGYPKGGNLMFGKHYLPNRGLNSIIWSRRAGVKISYAISGLSEVWTTKLVNGSIYKDSVCSCHTKIESNHCGECYKCLRKLPIINKQEKITKKAVDKFKTVSKVKPLKMACSTIYGIQKINTDEQSIRNFDKYDVSFLDRYSEWHQNLFNDNDTKNFMSERFEKHGIKKMDKSDYKKIKNFKDSINE